MLRAAGADRLHLPALEHDPRLVALLDEVVVEGLAVFDDRHGADSSMKNIARSAIVEHSAAEMYALVENIEAYPEFLPWCTAAQVHERLPGRTRATLTVGVGGLSHAFTTLNDTRPGEAIDMHLVSGPFRRFEGRWRFVALAPRCLPHRVLPAIRVFQPGAGQGAVAALRRHRRLHGGGLRAPRYGKEARMKVEVVYALPDRVDMVSVSVRPGATLRDAVVASGLAQRHPEISLEKQAFGIFGRRVPPETRLAPGDRIEVYRRWPWIRRKPAGSARRRNAERLAAFLHQLARARRLLGDLGVLQVVALAFRVGARDALPALERAQRLLRPRAVLALGRRFLFRLRLRFSRSFCASSWRLRYAASGLSGFSALGRRRRGWRRSGGRRLHASRLDAGRRHVAVANLAIRVDPFDIAAPGARPLQAKQDRCSGHPCGEKSFVIHESIMPLCE